MRLRSVSVTLPDIEFAEQFVRGDHIDGFGVRLDNAEKETTSALGLRLPALCNQRASLEGKVLGSVVRPGTAEPGLEVLLGLSAPISTPKPLLRHAGRI